MAYEIRVNGRTVAIHERQRDALAEVKQMVARDPDTQAEIINTLTGKPAAPAASAEDREDYATKVGF